MTDIELGEAVRVVRDVRDSMTAIEASMLLIEAMLEPVEKAVNAALAEREHAPTNAKTAPHAPTMATTTASGDETPKGAVLSAEGALAGPPGAEATAEALRHYYCTVLGMTPKAWGNLWNVKPVGDLTRIRVNIVRLYQGATRGKPSQPAQPQSAPTEGAGGFGNPEGPANDDQRYALTKLAGLLGEAFDPKADLSFVEAKGLIRDWNVRLQKKRKPDQPAAEEVAERHVAMSEPVTAPA